MFNVLLQVLDDGRITDGQGRTVDFKNTVIILTSNLGSSVILDGIDDDGQLKENAKTEVEMLLKRSFRPEFLNRLDEIVFFKPLDKTQIGAIVKLLAEDLAKRLKDKQLTLTISAQAVEFIVENGYDASFGARPLKRYLQHKLQTAIAKKMLAGEFSAGDEVFVGVKDNALSVEKR